MIIAVHIRSYVSDVFGMNYLNNNLFTHIYKQTLLSNYSKQFVTNINCAFSCAAVPLYWSVLKKAVISKLSILLIVVFDPLRCPLTG